MTEQEFEEYMGNDIQLILRFEGDYNGDEYDVYDALNIPVGKCIGVGNHWIFMTERAMLRIDELRVIADFMEKREKHDAT